MTSFSADIGHRELTFSDRVRGINWGLILLLCIISGAGFATTFRRIVLPLIAPMLLSVFLLMFVATLRDISTVVLLAGPGTRTMSLLMFEFANSGKFESAAVVGILIALMSLLIIAIAFRFNDRAGARS